jgi:hypothetical protein
MHARLKPGATCRHRSSMSYRDEGDARAARIDALEHELAEARRRIAELEAGAPVGRVVRVTRTRDGEVYTFDRGMGYEQRAELARGLGDHLGVSGAVELSPPLIIWRGAGKRLELEGTADATILTCRDQHSRRRWRGYMLACWIAGWACVASWQDSTMPVGSLVAGMLFLVLGLGIGLVSFLRCEDVPAPPIGDRAASFIEESCLALPAPAR